MTGPRVAATLLFQRLGYIGAFGALYVCAAVVLLVRLTHHAVPAVVVGSVVSLACGVFLLDRVKPADRFSDAADECAHPARHAFIWRHRRPLRALVVVLVLAAVAGMLATSPWLAVFVPLALGGVLIYGSLPRRPRPKDVLLVKNAAVSGAIAALCVGVLAIAGTPHDVTLPRDLPLIVVASSVVIVQVFLDAMLCDLDDMDADRAFGTKTVPVQFGPSRTWVIAAALQIIAVLAIITIAAWKRLALAWTLTVCVLLTFSFVGLWSTRNRPVRDSVDLRLPLFVLLAELITFVGGFEG